MAATVSPAASRVAHQSRSSIRASMTWSILAPCPSVQGDQLRLVRGPGGTAGTGSEREVPRVAAPAKREAVPVVAGMADVDRTHGHQRLAQPRCRVVGLA